jgi:hypothetical protein
MTRVLSATVLVATFALIEAPAQQGRAAAPSAGASICTGSHRPSSAALAPRTSGRRCSTAICPTA